VPEPNDRDADATPHTVNERVQQEVGEPVGRVLPASRLFQFTSCFEHMYYNPDLPKIRLADGSYVIPVELPDELAVDEVDPHLLGQLLVFYMRGPINSLIPMEERESLIADLKDGHSTIFGANMEFLTNLRAGR
jgi:hypothetical protein